jgi:hypothetical protein
MQTLLQQYTRPVGQHTESIRIEWTPHFRAFHLCRNLNRFDDESLPIPRRYSSFDANNKECVREKVSSPSLINSLEQLGSAIATHIWQVSGETTRVSLMTLFVQRTEVVDQLTGLPSVVLKLQYCTRLKTRRMNSGSLVSPEPLLSLALSQKGQKTSFQGVGQQPVHKDIRFEAFRGRSEINSKQILETVRLGKLEDEETKAIVDRIGRHCAVCLTKILGKCCFGKLGDLLRWKGAWRKEVRDEVQEVRRRRKVEEEGGDGLAGTTGVSGLPGQDKNMDDLDGMAEKAGGEGSLGIEEKGKFCGDFRHKQSCWSKEKKTWCILPNTGDNCKTFW